METEQHSFERILGHQGSQKGNLKVSQSKENGDTTSQNLWDEAKAVLTGEFITMRVYILKKKIERFQINNNNHLKDLEKQEQTKPQMRRGKEINNKEESGPGGTSLQFQYSGSWDRRIKSLRSLWAT
jgi:hypothetical protein